MADASVLIVDDDEHVRAVLTDMLQELGYHVIAVEDGQTAVREVESAEYDVVLIDVHMPNQDGVQVLRELRAMAPDSRYVMISGVRDPELAETCRRLGARAFLAKPLRLGEITRLIDELAGSTVRLLSWEGEHEAVVESAPPQEPVVATEPAEPVVEVSIHAPGPGPRLGAERAEGTRLRDPVAVFRSRDCGEVLARFACTVYAEGDSAERSAHVWRGTVDEFHLAPSDEMAVAERLTGTLVLRDAVRGLFAGHAILRGNEIVADGPLQHTPPLARRGLNIRVRRAAQDPSVTVLELEGDLSDEHTEQLREALRDVLRAGRTRIVVHLEGLNFLDSSAVKACLWAVPQVRGRNGDLKIAGAKGDIWRILEIVGAHRTLSCYATEADAVASFAHTPARA